MQDSKHREKGQAIFSFGKVSEDRTGVKGQIKNMRERLRQGRRGYEREVQAFHKEQILKKQQQSTN